MFTAALPTTGALGRPTVTATEAGPERTASTKTYTAGLAALHLAIAHMTGRGAAAADEVVSVAATVSDLLDRLPRLAEDAELAAGDVIRNHLAD